MEHYNPKVMAMSFMGNCEIWTLVERQVRSINNLVIKRPHCLQSYDRNVSHVEHYLNYRKRRF